jgi:putative phosphoribosyl transferase
MIFKDRINAATLLAPLLNKYRGARGVVLAVPRGGVPVAHYIAKYLDFDLDLAMTKKLGHPFNPEFAIGAVSLEDAAVDERTDVSKKYIEEEIHRIQQLLLSQYQFYRDDEPPAELKDKVVIIVDDGIATGKTMLATIRLVREKKPKKIVVAVPVAAPSSVKKIKETADEFICLSTPGNFIGVGQFFEDFWPVEDEDVIELMKDGNYAIAENPE